MPEMKGAAKLLRRRTGVKSDAQVYRRIGCVLSVSGLYSPDHRLIQCGTARRELGRWCSAAARRFLHAEIVPANVGLVVVMPGGAVTQRLYAGKRHREHRAFHVALLQVEFSGSRELA